MPLTAAPSSGSVTPVLTPRQLTAKDRTVSWKLEWRLGGTRAGDRQSLTFSEKKFGGQAEGLARRAALLVEAHAYGLTRREAARQLLGDDTEAAPPVLTLNDWFDRWIANKTGIEPRQLSDYRGAWALHMEPGIGCLDLGDVDREAVRAWIVKMEAQPAIRGGTKPKPGRSKSKRPRVVKKVKTMAAGTVRRHFSLLHQVLAAASHAHPELLPANPAAGMSDHLPKAHHGQIRETRVFLTRPEAAVFLEGFQAAWARDLVDVLFATGLRWGEITALQAGDLIDGENGEGAVRVERAWKLTGKRWELVDPGPDDDEVEEYERWGLGAPKSVRSRRTVTMNARIFAVLKRNCVVKGPMELVFGSLTGTMVHHSNFMNRHWWPAVAVAQGKDPESGRFLPKSVVGKRRLLTKRPTPHSCRHSHASWLISDGIAVARVSGRLGHDSVDITYRFYGHFQPNQDGDIHAAAQLA